MDSPVALFFYRRPGILERVFEAVRSARPRRLLLVADGPKEDADEEELRAVEEARRMVERIDWPCEVSKKYSGKNLGCRKRLRTGLDWVFSTVDEAIVLEDDCLPHPDFFAFCARYLERCRDEPGVLSICGTNPLPANVRPSPCLFSSYFRPTGWATWSSAWQEHFDIQMPDWPAFRDSGGLDGIVSTEEARSFWKATMDSTVRGWNDSWAWAWQYSHWRAGAITVRPPVNLVRHLGYGPDSAHHRGEEDISDPWEAMGLSPLPTGALHSSPGEAVPDPDIDDLILRFTLGMIPWRDLEDPVVMRNRPGWPELDRLHRLLFRLQAELRQKEDVIQDLLSQRK